MLRSLSPDECELEFGVKFAGEAGAVIAKTSTEGHFVVKLSWARPHLHRRRLSELRRAWRRTWPCRRRRRDGSACRRAWTGPSPGSALPQRRRRGQRLPCRHPPRRDLHPRGAARARPRRPRHRPRRRHGRRRLPPRRAGRPPRGGDRRCRTDSTRTAGDVTVLSLTGDAAARPRTGAPDPGRRRLGPPVPGVRLPAPARPGRLGGRHPARAAGRRLGADGGRRRGLPGRGRLQRRGGLGRRAGGCRRHDGRGGRPPRSARRLPDPVDHAPAGVARAGRPDAAALPVPGAVPLPAVGHRAVLRPRGRNRPPGPRGPAPAAAGGGRAVGQRQVLGRLAGGRAAARPRAGLAHR